MIYLKINYDKFHNVHLKYTQIYKLIFELNDLFEN